MSLIKKDTRNHADSDIKLVLEIHASLVTRKMLSYNVRDLVPGGRLYNNPYSIEGTQKQVSQIANYHYNVTPYVKNLFNGKKHLSGYAYLMDSKDGMMVVHEEPVPDPDPNNETGTRTSRFLTAE